jgi:hypothetical protein
MTTKKKASPGGAGEARKGFDDLDSHAQDTTRGPKKPISPFAKLPYRALKDSRFCLPTRVFGYIAYRNRQGNGCKESQHEMAAFLKCSYWMISRTIRDLMEWEYIERYVSPQDKRRWVYRDIPDKVVAVRAQRLSEIVAVANSQAIEKQNGFFDPLRKSSSKERVGSTSSLKSEDAYTMLSRFEKNEKSGTSDEADCERAFNTICKILDDYEDHDDPIYQYALRLLRETDWPTNISFRNEEIWGKQPSPGRSALAHRNLESIVGALLGHLVDRKAK